MNITSAQYKTCTYTNENGSIEAIIDGIKWSIPLDPENRHYAALLEWAEEAGNEIQAAE